jgi:hypothetical protein
MAIQNSSLFVGGKARYFKTTPNVNMGGGMNVSNIHAGGNGIYKNITTQRVEDAMARTISWTEVMSKDTLKDLQLWWNNNNPVKQTIVFDGMTLQSCILESFPKDTAITKEITITFIVENMASF